MSQTPDDSASSRLHAAYRTSWLRRTTERVSDRLEAVAERSRILDALDQAGAVLGRTLRSSRLYAWLTAEPDPEVIVIDLRETYTVGPIIGVLDRLAPVVERIWRGSYAHTAIEKLRASSKRAWLVDSKTVRLLRAALEPPEPPEQNRRK